MTCVQMQDELDRHVKRFRELGLDVVAPGIVGQSLSSEQLLTHMDGVVGLIAGDDELDRHFFDNSPDLRVLVRWGIGTDSVDFDAARDHQVIVRNTPGVFGGEVADSAMAYILMLARRHHEVDRAVRDGEWPKVRGTSLRDSVLGIVGHGDIGRALAARGSGFGMRVQVYDPYVDADRVAPGTELVSSVEELAVNSRFLVLTCPLTDETHHLIGAAQLALMGEDAFLVNVARGPVVDEVALVEALRLGRPAGAGLDVFETEPLPESSPLRTLPSVVLGAHNGSNTAEGVARASARAVDILLEELAHGD